MTPTRTFQCALLPSVPPPTPTHTPRDASTSDSSPFRVSHDPQTGKKKKNQILRYKEIIVAITLICGVLRHVWQCWWLGKSTYMHTQQRGAPVSAFPPPRNFLQQPPVCVSNGSAGGETGAAGILTWMACFCRLYPSLCPVRMFQAYLFLGHFDQMFTGRI